MIKCSLWIKKASNAFRKLDKHLSIEFRLRRNCKFAIFMICLLFFYLTYWSIGVERGFYLKDEATRTNLESHLDNCQHPHSEAVWANSVISNCIPPVRLCADLPTVSLSYIGYTVANIREWRWYPWMQSICQCGTSVLVSSGSVM